MKLIILACLLLLVGCDTRNIHNEEIKGVVVKKVMTAWPTFFMSVKDKDGITRTFEVASPVYYSCEEGETIHFASGNIQSK